MLWVDQKMECFGPGASNEDSTSDERFSVKELISPLFLISLTASFPHVIPLRGINVALGTKIWLVGSSCPWLDQKKAQIGLARGSKEPSLSSGRAHTDP